MSSRIDRDGGGDDLHDANLRRALDHAPDRDDQPAAPTRAAILKMAHNMADAPAAAAANNARVVPWWRRVLGLGEPGARMPWNAAFATVLVAGFVAVLWHREPIPDARPDGEARVSEAPAAVPAPAQAPLPQASDAPAPVAPVAAPPAQAAAPAAPPAQATAPASAPAPAAPPAASAPPAAVARDRAASPSAALEERKVEAPRRAAPSPEPPAVAKPGGPSAFPASPRAAEPVAPAAPAAIAPSAPAAIAPSAPAAIAPLPAPVARARPQEEALSAAPGSNRTADAAVAAAAPPPPPAAAYAPAPATPPPVIADRERRGAFAAGAAAKASGAQGEAAPPRPARAAKSATASAAPEAPTAQTAPPVFTALDTWTDLTFTRAGLGVRHARGDLEGLPALVSAVARSATVPGASLAAPLEARMELHRGQALTAVLEIAGDEVRWTSQPGGASYTGTPPAAVLAALRSLLTR